MRKFKIELVISEVMSHDESRLRKLGTAGFIMQSSMTCMGDILGLTKSVMSLLATAPIRIRAIIKATAHVGDKVHHSHPNESYQGYRVGNELAGLGIDIDDAIDDAIDADYDTIFGTMPETPQEATNKKMVG